MQKYHKIAENFQKYHTCIFQFLPYNFGSNSAPYISWLLEGTLSSPLPGAMKLFTEEDFLSQDTFLTASHAYGNLRRSPAEYSRVFPAGLIGLSDHKQHTATPKKTASQEVAAIRPSLTNRGAKSAFSVHYWREGTLLTGRSAPLLRLALAHTCFGCGSKPARENFPTPCPALSRSTVA